MCTENEQFEAIIPKKLLMSCCYDKKCDQYRITIGLIYET